MTDQNTTCVDETLEAINLVKMNMPVEEIFDVFELDSYATCVCGTKTPEDVFDEATLEKWALDNGFTR